MELFFLHFAFATGIFHCGFENMRYYYQIDIFVVIMVLSFAIMLRLQVECKVGWFAHHSLFATVAGFRFCHHAGKIIIIYVYNYHEDLYVLCVCLSGMSLGCLGRCCCAVVY